MSFGGYGGRTPRTGLATCLQCNQRQVSGLELLLFGKPSNTPNRKVWQCPSCKKYSWVDTLQKNFVYVDESDGSDESSDEDASSDEDESCDDDDMEDKKCVQDKSTSKVDSDLKLARSGMSKLALDSSKFGGSNMVSPADEEKSRRRVRMFILSMWMSLLIVCNSMLKCTGLPMGRKHEMLNVHGC